MRITASSCNTELAKCNFKQLVVQASNVSTDQLFGSCVDALTTDYENRQNYPSLVQYFSPLLHPTQPYARPRWSAHGTRAVGRSVVSNF